MSAVEHQPLPIEANKLALKKLGSKLDSKAVCTRHVSKIVAWRSSTSRGLHAVKWKVKVQPGGRKT